MWNFCLFEIKYRLKHLSTYFASLIVFIPLFYQFYLGTKPPIDSSNIVFLNAPIQLYAIILTTSQFSILLLSYFVFSMYHRLKTDKFDEILFSQPLKKRDYILGHLSGIAIILLIIMVIGLIITFSLKFTPFFPKELFTKDHLLNYLQPLLVIFIPNTFIFGAIYIFVATFTKKASSIFFTYVIIYMFRITLMVLEAATDISGRIFGYIDPMGAKAFDEFLSNLSLEDVNTKRVDIPLRLMMNRLIWAALGTVLIFLSIIKLKKIKHDI